MRIDFLSSFSVKGKLITSEKPFSTRKSSIFEILFCSNLNQYLILEECFLILSYPIILAISSDRSF